MVVWCSPYFSAYGVEPRDDDRGTAQPKHLLLDAALARPLCRSTVQQFPAPVLFLPGHQHRETGVALLAVGDGLAGGHPMEPHDRGVANHADRRVLVFQYDELDLPAVAFLMNVALSSMCALEWL